MKKICAAILIGLATIAFTSGAGAASTAATASYRLAKQLADTGYQRAHEQCIALSEGPSAVCVAEAEAVRTRAKSSAKVQYKGTRQAHAHARIAVANADYAVAKAKCESHTGKDKDVCLQEAATIHVAIRANGKADKKIIAARNEAVKETADANLKLALPK
ncbi:MAG TPA: hypothetical protein VL051_10255 [Burkholderiaceae bacterium]|nr:hypothetical protein [Burkholderiaceae bacterium]